MTIENIKIDNILVEDSRFSINDYLFETSSGTPCLSESFRRLGILYPIIVYRDDHSHLHLVDGSRRIRFAQQNHQEFIRAIVLPENTPLTDIISLIICTKRSSITSSIINRIQCICFAMSLNAPEHWIVQALCQPFEFKPHSEFLRECERICGLPKQLRFICHEKRFSFKQILNLTYHPTELLAELVKWKSELQLTASTLDEIASNLKYYLKKENKKVSEFLSEPDVSEILESSLNPREKTEKLRELLHIKQFPVLYEVNSRIQDKVSDLHLPKEIHINWDRTLENKNVSLSLNITNPEKWKALTEVIRSEDVKDAIERILDEL